MHRTYLDNAATTWPKPKAVYEAVERYMRQCGAAAGRAGYADAVHAERLVASARSAVAELIAADQPRRIVFALNGTDALNIAIHGLVRPGSHVVTTDAEHNSVLRPLRHLEEQNSVHISRVPCNEAGVVNAGDVADALRPDTCLVAMTHASNVTGAIQPIAEIGALVRAHGALLLVDAAQSIGHFAFTVEALSIDLLASSGHKGLLGPLGTGVLYVGPRAEPHIGSFRQGGTGTESQDDRQPEQLPERLEAGNLNMPGICGLAAGAQYLLDEGLANIRRHEVELTGRLIDGLSAIDGVKIYGPLDAERQVGVASLTIANFDPQEVAASLDSGFGIQVRAGLQCAPRIHQVLGTAATGGTVRFSFGPFNTTADVEAVVAAVSEIAAAAVPT